MESSGNAFLRIGVPLPSLERPRGAEDLFPSNIGPRIFHFPEKKQILKAGPSVKMCEAEAMRFVAQETTVPVPEVYESYVENGNGFILMAKLEGVPLADLWDSLKLHEREVVITQMREYMRQIDTLHGEFYGALWEQPSEDIFFTHMPFKPEKLTYGPYTSRQQYNEGLVEALRHSKPTEALSDHLDEDLIDRLLGIHDDAKVLCHGDLQLTNILVNKANLSVTGIIDWEGAGFSIRGRDYYEAKSRTRNSAWAEALDEIFPEAKRADFELLQELDRALVRYTFI